MAITDKFSMDSLILHGSSRGWALDSSWRNKNENRAAVTFLIAVDEKYHAVPGASMRPYNDSCHLSTIHRRCISVSQHSCRNA